MRILFTGLRTKNLVNMNVIHFLEEEVSKHADCKWSGHGWPDHKSGENIDETVKRLYGKDPPDFIVCNRPNREEYQTYVDNKSKLPPVITTLADLHVEPKEWVRLVNNASNGVLMRYLYCPYQKKNLYNRYTYYSKLNENYYLENIKQSILHFPWFTEPKIYRPSDEKENDVIFLGAYRQKVYPLRNKIVNQLPKLCEDNNWKYIVRGRPPGESVERNISELLKQGYIVGEKYAETIAKSKVFIFGSSIFRYPLSKYFEIMGSGTLVMANKPQTSEKLHFVSGENYVEITEKDWKEKLEYYLEDDVERERIARNGYETAMKYHISEIRAKQLLEFLHKLNHVS
jgi:glycosyltransferase involved in cell wall biosynthesis